MNGFFLGLLMGAGLTLLFTTKKGKRIVKTLTEEGLEDLSKLQDIIDTIQGEDIAPDGKIEKSQAPMEPPVVKEIATRHRFFKGTRKKI